MEVIEEFGDYSGVDRDGLADIDELVHSEGSYADVADTLRTKVFQYITDDEGTTVTGEALRQVFEKMGHDSVIDYRVDDKFGENRKQGQKMQGLYDGEFHVISFEGNQIKSSAPFTGVPLNQRFNDGNDLIKSARAPEIKPEPESTPRPSDDLAGNVLEGLTGVSQDWLGGVKPFFDRLAALAESGDVSDDDFIEALDGAQTQLPELFDSLDTDALKTAFENSTSAGMFAGAEHQLTK